MGIETLDDVLERISSDGPPTKTIYLRLFKNSPPEGSPVVLRLLDGEKLRDISQRIGKLPNDDEKAPAWIRYPIAWSFITIDGIPVPENWEKRYALVYKLSDPVITELYRAYSNLESDELLAQQKIVDAADSPNSFGADSGEASAPDSGGTDQSPSTSSIRVVPARAVAWRPPLG